MPLHNRATLPGTQEYLMVCQLDNKHPENHIMYSVKLREVFPNGVSASFRYETRPFYRYQRRRLPPPPVYRIPEDHLELRQTIRIIFDGGIMIILQPPPPFLYQEHHFDFFGKPHGGGSVRTRRANIDSTSKVVLEQKPA